MTYRVAMVVDHPRRDVVQCFCGCVDDMDAKSKARTLFTVIRFKTVEPTTTVGKKYAAKTAEPVVNWSGPTPNF